MSSREGLLDPFDLLVMQRGISKSSVFKYLDEFSVFSYYIEEALGPMDIEEGVNIRSPLREDDTSPSFRLYYGNADRLLFTDYGDKNKTGDVVTFVSALYNISLEEALRKIIADFGLSGEVPSTPLPERQHISKPKKQLDIAIKPFTKQELAFGIAFT